MSWLDEEDTADCNERGYPRRTLPAHIWDAIAADSDRNGGLIRASVEARVNYKHCHCAIGAAFAGLVTPDEPIEARSARLIAEARAADFPLSELGPDYSPYTWWDTLGLDGLGWNQFDHAHTVIADERWPALPYTTEMLVPWAEIAAFLNLHRGE